MIFKKIKQFKKLLSEIEKLNLHLQDVVQFHERPYYPLDSNWALTKLNTGHYFFVNTEDRNITPWIIMSGNWEPDVDRVLSEYVKPGMTVIDIGAHFGYYTVKLAAKLEGVGKLHSFEPNPEVNQVCLENIKINALGVASLHKYALGDTNGKATLTRSKSNMTSANLVGEQDADISFEVEVRRLDDVIEEDGVDLIKLDAEGYEKKILEGSSQTLMKSSHCAIMIELGLERWERMSSLNDLIPLSGGGGKELYRVQSDGTLRHISINDVRKFLLGCPFHENYFLVARPDDAKKHVGSLIVN